MSTPINQVTFTINATPENQSTINQVVALISGGNHIHGTQKPTQDEPVNTEDSNIMEFAEFKKIAIKIKKEHGEPFALEVIGDLGHKLGSTLGRTISKLSEDQYADIIAKWETGPVEEKEDDDGLDDDLEKNEDDDGLGDDETPAKVDPEAVKDALKAYNKEHGRPATRELMAEHGVENLGEVSKLSAKKLAALMANLV